MTPSRDIGRLLEIMAALRTPRTGCPWDLEQNFATIAPYTLEEAYEVADAIARDDLTDLKEELGDLLLQVVFHARMAEEQGAFAFGDVVEAITAKLIRRHPHVFGDAGPHTTHAVEGLWERIKAQEKQEKAARGGAEKSGALAGVPVGLPALTRALKLQDKASKVGFDWNDPRAVLRQNPRGSRRDRSRARRRRDRRRGRSRRSSVRRSQSRAPSARRPGSGVAADQPEIRTPLRRDRAGAGRRRKKTARRDASRNGRAVGRSQGARMITALRPRAGTADRRTAPALGVTA